MEDSSGAWHSVRLLNCTRMAETTGCNLTIYACLKVVRVGPVCLTRSTTEKNNRIKIIEQNFVQKTENDWYIQISILRLRMEKKIWENGRVGSYAGYLIQCRIWLVFSLKYQGLKDMSDTT